MSLVERAIKKLQESRGTAPTAPELPAATAPAPRAAAARADVARPTRVVHIDRARLRDVELVPPPEQERQIAHDYRQIKRPLIANAFGRGVPVVPMGHLVMVTSALPGDGKTFTSVNLALSMALEKDISVLLVDADVAKPHISRILGVDQEPGLLDVLHDASLEIDSVILPTDVPGLSILPAGRASDTATELLASARMQEIGAILDSRDANRMVLFDSPPLLLTSESRALAHSVGQVVIVVRAEYTPQQAVLDAIEKLGANRSISLVLNQSKITTAAYYGYGSAGGLSGAGAA